MCRVNETVCACLSVAACVGLVPSVLTVFPLPCPENRCCVLMSLCKWTWLAGCVLVSSPLFRCCCIGVFGECCVYCDCGCVIDSVCVCVSKSCECVTD